MMPWLQPRAEAAADPAPAASGGSDRSVTPAPTTSGAIGR
jgi:hypothetical protein